MTLCVYDRASILVDYDCVDLSVCVTMVCPYASVYDCPPNHSGGCRCICSSPSVSVCGCVSDSQGLLTLVVPRSVCERRSVWVPRFYFFSPVCGRPVIPG